MFSGIPQQRLLFYLLLLGVVPLALAWLSSSRTINGVNTTASRLQLLHEKAVLADSREASNKAVMQHFSQADHHYIDKFIEALPLLESEIESLEALLQGDEVAVDERLSTRLQSLKADNRLVFTEGNVVSYATFQETLETLSHPVEVDVDDIASLLSRVEGTTLDSYKPGPGRPQLIITKFHIDRQGSPQDSKGKPNSHGGNEAFLLNMQLLKREYL